MNEEKLPKELLVISGKMLPNIYSDCLDHVELQRNADQLLYDAALEEVERLGAELAKVKLEMVGFITRYCDSRMTQHTGYGGQEELERLKTLITSRYGV